MFARHHDHEGHRGHWHECSPRGRRGRGDFGEGPDELGGWGRIPGGRGGRVFGPGDLKLVLLSLIAEKPRHGYDLIRAIEETFGGTYAPSPGAVYPTLTLLEEQDYIRGEAASGGKKLYAITPEGEAHLNENRIAVDGVKARLSLAAAAFASHSTPAAVREAVHTLRHALHMRRGVWSAAETERVRALLEKAARDIVGGGAS
jgi:DNA-binding PadR family transcriptional regulator